MNFDDDDDELMGVQQAKPKKTWRENIFVPLGLFGGALALGGAIVIYRGRRGTTPLAQRMMEARVVAQATLLAGILTLGVVGFGATRRSQEVRTDIASSYDTGNKNKNDQKP